MFFRMSLNSKLTLVYLSKYLNLFLLFTHILTRLNFMNCWIFAQIHCHDCHIWWLQIIGGRTKASLKKWSIPKYFKRRISNFSKHFKDFSSIFQIRIYSRHMGWNRSPIKGPFINDVTHQFNKIEPWTFTTLTTYLHGSGIEILCNKMTLPILSPHAWHHLWMTLQFNSTWH